MFKATDILEILQNKVLSEIDVAKVDDMFKSFDEYEAKAASEIIKNATEKVVNSYVNSLSKKELKNICLSFPASEREIIQNTMRATHEEVGSLYTIYAVRLCVLNKLESINENINGYSM